MSSTNVTEIEGFDRFTKGMCPAKLFKNFFDGICSRFSNTGFFINTVGFILIAVIYKQIGKGKYWKILFYAGLSGLIGALIENGTMAYVCREADKNTPRKKIVIFLLNEVFWIVKEYAVPLLNLTKLKTFNIKKIYIQLITITVGFLGLLFSASRFYIGYHRMKAGLLTTKNTRFGHTGAFVIAGIADLICSVTIIIIVKKNNNKHHARISNNLIDIYIKRSSYLAIILIDFVSIILAFLNVASEVFEIFTSSYITPFHCLKTSFIIILACDAMIFKHNVNSGSQVSMCKVTNQSNSVSIDFTNSNAYNPTTENTDNDGGGFLFHDKYKSRAYPTASQTKTFDTVN